MWFLFCASLLEWAKECRRKNFKPPTRWEKVLKRDSRFRHVWFDSLKLKRIGLTSTEAASAVQTYPQRLDAFSKKVWWLRQFINFSPYPVVPNFLEIIEKFIVDTALFYSDINDPKDCKGIQEKRILFFFLKLPFNGIVHPERSLRYITRFYDSAILLNSTHLPTAVLRMWKACLMAPAHKILYLITDFLLFLTCPLALTYWNPQYGGTGERGQLYWIAYFLYEILLEENPKFDFEATNLISLSNIKHLNYLWEFTSDSFIMFELSNRTSNTFKNILNKQGEIYTREDSLIRKKIELSKPDTFFGDNRYFYLYYFGDDISFFYNKDLSFNTYNVIFNQINLIKKKTVDLYLNQIHSWASLEKKFFYTTFILAKVKNRMEPYHKMAKFYYWNKYVYGYEFRSLNCWFWDYFGRKFLIKDRSSEMVQLLKIKLYTFKPNKGTIKLLKLDESELDNDTNFFMQPDSIKSF